MAGEKKRTIIVGDGPAGISAALYLVRLGLHTTVVGNRNSDIKKADKIENYYGISGGISGEELLNIGIKQASELGAEILSEEVIGIEFDGRFKIITPSSALSADAVILATGVRKKNPPIPNIADFEGRGVSYCAVCDAFFYRGKNVAVVGNGEYALSELRHLLPIAASVTLLLNGEQPTVSFPDEVRCIRAGISALDGNETLSSLRFEDGTAIEVDALFVAMGIATSSDLARKIGAVLNGKYISVDREMQTSVPGIFAAGDCVGGLLQISKAVGEGAVAADSANKYLRKIREESLK